MSSPVLFPESCSCRSFLSRGHVQRFYRLHQEERDFIFSLPGLLRIVAQVGKNQGERAVDGDHLWMPDFKGLAARHADSKRAEWLRTDVPGQTLKGNHVLSGFLAANAYALTKAKGPFLLVYSFMGVLMNRSLKVGNGFGP